ncbi:MAG: ROK family protein [Betaproteobacteria bacterium]|nr:ROK family protein [Pseudomonadota bacterium]NBQ94949.1 ROK family protein [Betaproteobacteria bacterium]NBS39056.1 ROK family protein [Betaproteobacteria bacterium]
MKRYRFGVDLGGTKTEAILLDPQGHALWRQRVPTPRGDYQASLDQIAGLLQAAREAYPRAGACSIGIGIPGSLDEQGIVRNANSTWLIGKAMRLDLQALIGEPIAMANDANCLALSEAADGAGAGFSCVFAVIMGTGVGAGLVVDRKLWAGAGGLAGEWGHVSLPWPRLDWGEVPGPLCWCSRRACIECFLSGPALAREIGRTDANVQAALTDPRAPEALERFYDRLARAMAMVINIVDPEVIVLGGGLSLLDSIYQEIPARWQAWVFSNREPKTLLRPALHGDASGVRGAAWLREPL